VELSEAAKEQIAAAVEHHPMCKHIFYEAHMNWDSALMQMRLVFEPLHSPGSLCQTASFVDDGSGSTCKGTVRELVEACIGVHNGKEQVGYSCTMTVETLSTKKAEAPSEQKANLFMCSHAFIDDFSPNEPLNNVALRQLTGGNNLTAARKGAAEQVFKFKGQIFLQVNGLWRPLEPFIGSDRRRHAGLTFDVKFVDNPTGLNEVKKNSGIKQHIDGFFEEFWFLARVFWLVRRPRPSSDRTMPLCPNSAALTLALMREGDDATTEVAEADVDRFIELQMAPYVLNPVKPASAIEVDQAFSDYLRCSVAVHRGGVGEDVARAALRTRLFYKAGHTVNRSGTRKKTSQNLYMLKGTVLTLDSCKVAPAA
jgi:hypothetical protein